MLNIVFYPLVAFTLYIIYLLTLYFRNAYIAHCTKFPTIHIPLIQPNSILWSIFAPPSRLLLKRRLPLHLYNRIVLAIYGNEYHQRNEGNPYSLYVNPQLHSNPALLGKGKSYFLVTSGRLELWTWDSEIAAQMTKRNNDFIQFDAASLVMNVFGENVLTTDGSTWSRHRRIVAGAVTEKVSPVVFREAVRQTRGLLASIGDNTDTRQMFDMIKRVAIHVLYAAGFGNIQDFSTSEGEQVKPGMKMTYIDAVKVINENAYGPTVFPTWVRFWPRSLPGSAWLRHLAQAKLEFPVHTRDALAKEKSAQLEKGGSRNNVMSALIKASEEDEEKGRKGPALTDEELVGNLYIFTAAGFDTSSNALAYALTLLARYPKWQSWLCDEIDALIPDPGAELDYPSIFPHAHRALAIMFETLRLFPPVIHVVKMTTAPQTLTTSTAGTFTIPAHCTVYVNSVALHRDPNVWRNLNMTPLEISASRDNEDGIRGDEHDYRPGRWINQALPAGSSKPMFQPPPGAYLPWSSGPRVCPGQKMAQVEFVAILVTLFSRHRMEVARQTVPVKGAEDVRVPESDDALNKRLDRLMDESTPKLTLEMDVYNVQPGEERGLALRWVRRR